MKDETRRWLDYAVENLDCAKLSANNGYFNAAIQNAQQAAEKAVKALIIDRRLDFHRTHNLSELRKILDQAGIDIGLSDENCELMDSIYLPSKYPMGSALPDYRPDENIARACISIAEGIVAGVNLTLAPSIS